MPRTIGTNSERGLSWGESKGRTKPSENTDPADKAVDGHFASLLGRGEPARRLCQQADAIICRGCTRHVWAPHAAEGIVLWPTAGNLDGWLARRSCSASIQGSWFSASSQRGRRRPARIFVKYMYWSGKAIKPCCNVGAPYSG
jgi:hypothetical protein